MSLRIMGDFISAFFGLDFLLAFDLDLDFDFNFGVLLVGLLRYFSLWNLKPESLRI
jgi:hypothetical protein